MARLGFYFHLYNFFPTTLYRGEIRGYERDENVSLEIWTRLGPLKDAIPTELQRRGRQDKLGAENFVRTNGERMQTNLAYILCYRMPYTIF